MDEEQLHALLNDKEFAQKVASQIFELWITPEVIRRQALGELERPLPLHAAQIIFFPDDRKPEIRINSETRIFAIPKYKEGIVKEIGDTVFEHEIDGVVDFVLGQDEDQDSGYVIIVKIGGRWLLAFDVRYNKALARKHIELAEQFLYAAELASNQGLLSPFIDNLFSASELSAKAILLPHYMNMRKNKNHNRVQEYFNDFTDLGNTDQVYRDIFVKLSSLRKPARYADYNMEISISEEERQKMLQTVRDMLETARIGIAIKESD